MKNGRDIASMGALVALTLAVLTFAGCISSQSNVTYGPKGPAVGRDTLRKIDCGRTDRAWLVAVLGEPTRTGRPSDGTEILTYEYTRTVDSDFSFCPFLDIDDRHEECTTYVFELNDGIVSRYWRD